MRIEKIRPELNEKNCARMDRIKYLLTELLDSFDPPREFQLCHHHLAPDDMLFDPKSNRVTLIDCANLQYSRAGRDLAAIKFWMFQENAEAWKKFLGEYAGASKQKDQTRLRLSFAGVVS